MTPLVLLLERTTVGLQMRAAALDLLVAVHAEDWPRYRGKGDEGVWNETGIVETLPKLGK